MTITEVEVVKRGAQYLDKTDPGWENKINLDTLNLRNCHVCILGQLDSDFWEEIKRRDMTFDDAAEYGFAIHLWDSNKNWDLLTEEWKKVIVQKRRNYSKSFIRKAFDRVFRRN